jgi:hypothetical protein
VAGFLNLRAVFAPSAHRCAGFGIIAQIPRRRPPAGPAAPDQAARPATARPDRTCPSRDRSAADAAARPSPFTGAAISAYPSSYCVAGEGRSCSLTIVSISSISIRCCLLPTLSPFSPSARGELPFLLVFFVFDLVQMQPAAQASQAPPAGGVDSYRSRGATRGPSRVTRSPALHSGSRWTLRWPR